MTANVANIHKTRVSVKKIYAIFHLLEMIGHGSFDRKKQAILFRDLFRYAGRIRELQLHLILLSGHHDPDTAITGFRKYLKDEQKKVSVKFTESLREFDEKKLKEIEREIRKAGQQVKDKTLKTIANEFLSKKMARIRSLQAKGDLEVNIHKIRQHLKTMVVIANVSRSLRPAGKSEKLLPSVVRAEKMIGEWHDNFVFLESLDKFYGNRKNRVPSLQIQEIRDNLQLRNNVLLGEITLAVEEVIK